MRVRYNGHRIPGDPARNLVVGGEHLVLDVKEYGVVILDDEMRELSIFADEVDLVNPCTDIHEPCGNEWFGTDVRDYFIDPVYKGARSLDEAIEIRGHLHEIRTAAPEDFDGKLENRRRHLGRIELWSSSLIGGIEFQYGFALAADSVHVGDRLRVAYKPDSLKRMEISFIDQDGTILPFSRYYDFDAQKLEKACLQVFPDGQIVCLVKEIRRSSGTCAPHDPECTWTVTDFVTEMLVEELLTD